MIAVKASVDAAAKCVGMTGKNRSERLTMARRHRIFILIHVGWSKALECIGQLRHLRPTCFLQVGRHFFHCLSQTLKTLVGYVRVDHGRGQMLVAENQLYHFERHTGFEKMRGEAVA